MGDSFKLKTPGAKLEIKEFFNGLNSFSCLLGFGLIALNGAWFLWNRVYWLQHGKMPEPSYVTIVLKDFGSWFENPESWLGVHRILETMTLQSATGWLGAAIICVTLFINWVLEV